eukprot:gb/GECH01001884.1/.p1 GENE.gb/GECH01001884.1/~~gb/GECH01001884.1/.p1  ORF type:complete len:214 (+),score=64.10 gb/GECH01001884.1/:1-642(+)
MKENENTVINGNNVICVPYKPKHVIKYHQWMKDSYLQEMTCSEPLSLEQEYEMQKSWHKDNEKCTFILIDKSIQSESPSNYTKAEEGMCGDVNLFISLEEESEHKKIGEIEVMVAEEQSRGKGIGTEAILLMMRYALEYLNIQYFTAKILENNHKSLYLFREKLLFNEIEYVSYFNHYEFGVDLEKNEDPATQRIYSLWEKYNICPLNLSSYQ